MAAKWRAGLFAEYESGNGDGNVNWRKILTFVGLSAASATITPIVQSYTSGQHIPVTVGTTVPVFVLAVGKVLTALFSDKPNAQQ